MISVTKIPRQWGLYRKIRILLGLSLLAWGVFHVFSSKHLNFHILTDPFDPFSDISVRNLSQNDSRILEHIRQYRLTEPSRQPYNLTPLDPFVNTKWTDPVSAYVLKLLKYKLEGFYVECGANDGEFLSNTLTMELKYGWTGLLVEADPLPLEILKKRNRRAWIAGVCLSTLPYPHKVEMLRHKAMNGVSYIEEHLKGRSMSDYSIKFSAQCFPIFSILSALGVKVVDYFSLDIEGAELAVLKTFPFDGPILIKVISAEVQQGKSKALKEFLTSKGYREVNFIQGPYVMDLIFAHHSVVDG